MRRAAARALLGCGLLAACDRGSGGTVRIDGSSTLFPILDPVAREFQRAELSKVALRVSGTTGGFRRFCAGEIDIAAASRAIKTVERSACGQRGIEYVEVPMACDGLSIVVNGKNHWANDITIAELEKLSEPSAQGRIVSWSQIRDGWPQRPISLFGAGRDSGTFDYFTEAITGARGAMRGDYVSSEDDEVVVRGVAGDPGALGFVGYMYYAKNRGTLRVLGVDDGNEKNGEGPISPTTVTIGNGTYQPFSRPLFIYAASGALARSEVIAFLIFS